MEKEGKYIPVPPLVVRRKNYARAALISLLTVLAVWYYVPNFGFHQVSLIAGETPESILLNALETNLAANWSKKYTSEAHLPGTNFPFVQWTADKFEEYGLKSTIDAYDIYVSYPDDHALNLLDKSGKIVYLAPLEEDEIDEDETTKGEGRVPTFLSYAANGNVTSQFVYANYGSREDFETLKKLGVDVKGKIAVVRYGGIFRGLKVKFAQDNGASAVLLYSDPGDDYGITPENGFEPYPHQNYSRHPSSVQRGSVQFLGGIGAAPGDPTTPGYASKGDVVRQDPHASIGKIPALPISYREVQPILKSLNGHGVKAPESWKGALKGYDYSIGPNSNVSLNLYNQQIYNITPLWNVYGEIEGENRDEVIIIGNHRDAWIKGGAGDPNSGSAVLIELARALGELKNSGYKFKRSIILQSYDGEEYGLLGSTEFGEFAGKHLQRKVVAYINLDVAVSGKQFHLSASPVLNELLKDILKKVAYPDKKVGSLYDHYKETRDLKIGNLGSGSDYTVFLEHLGIPAVDLGFGGAKDDPIYHYHSNYDSFYWMSEFGDKGFVYHNTVAKYLALLIYEISEHRVIRFGLRDYAESLILYYNDTVAGIPDKWFSKRVNNLEEFLKHDIQDRDFIHDATQGKYHDFSPYPFPELMEEFQCPHDPFHVMHDVEHHKNLTLGDIISHTYDDLKTLLNSTTHFDEKSKELQSKYESDDLPWWQRVVLHFEINHHNKLIQYFERNFLYYNGLHERTWFRHIVFAAGRYTGYAGQTWPGIREAVEDEDIDRLVKWLGIASKSVRRVTATLI